VKQAVMTEIDEMTWRFTEKAFGEAVYMYLLIGTEKALLIDTGYGFTDVPAAIRSVTDKPLIVVNTHGHMDHVHGNYLYPLVYLSENDEECFRRHTDSEYLKGLLKDVLKANHLPVWLMKLPGLHGHVEKVAASYPSRHIPLPPEGYFELGGRRVRIIETPGHTAGSICLLDEKNHWLFAGDTACHDGVLLHFPESTDVATYQQSITKLKALADDGEIETIFPCHQQTPLDTGILDTYLALCGQLLDQKPDEAALQAGKITRNGTAIQFDRNKIGGMNV